MEAVPRRTVVVVVAAGDGRRFEGPGHKLQQPLGDTSVLGMTLRQVVASGLPLVVVTTTALADEAARSVAAQDVVTVSTVAHDPRAGMGRSIAAGVMARPNAPGWLVLPADMPLVRPDSLLAVAQALEHAPVACAHHRGRRGHPVGFAAELYGELAVLEGDHGARRVVARYPSQAVELEDPGVLADVDTRADLVHARRLWLREREGVRDQA